MRWLLPTDAVPPTVSTDTRRPHDPAPRRASGCRHRPPDTAPGDARPNPYRTPCLLCGWQRCVACERFDARIRAATPNQIAALRAGQSRHWAKYHVSQPPLEDSAAWFSEVLAMQTADRRHGILSRIVRIRSPQARAERAFRAGHLGTALALFARAGRDDQVLTCLRIRLPVWAAKAELLAAARELLDLRRAVQLAKRGGVSATLTAGIDQEAAAASHQLWQRADRLALVAAQRPDPRTVASLLTEEAERLTRLAEAAARARDALALATLRGGAAALEPLRLGLELTGTHASEFARR
jgi:hypothetical protein